MHGDEVSDEKKPIWQPPTRRAFVAMLTAAAAALVVKDTRPVDRPRSTWNGKTRWIGHC